MTSDWKTAAYTLARPILMRMDPETAHSLTLKALRMGASMLPHPGDSDPILKTTLWGRVFPNPIGLAAGFDKNAEVIAPMLGFGFGFVEAGTVTPRPQDGNPRPRIFRAPDQGAVINRMGFPGQGLQVFKTNLERFLDNRPRPPGVVGINIGMNKTQTEPLKDYALLVNALGALADYITVNISSPNTPGLRALQKADHLRALLEGIMDARTRACGSHPPPLLVKLAPDLEDEDIVAIAETVRTVGVDGLVLTNTTLDRPKDLPPAFAAQAGGLSGRPLKDKSTRVLRAFYQATGGHIPLIGAGGISSGADAYEKIRAGASLVQLYSALVYQGPGLPGRIARELADLLKRDGFSSVSAAIGADAGAPSSRSQDAHAA